MGININDKGVLRLNEDLYLGTDLDTVFTFKHWVKENLEIYRDKSGTDKDTKVVPYEHLLIYLEYLSTIIMDNKDIDRSAWLKQVGRLIVKTKKIIRSKDEE
jgi:hypothetical protein